VHPIELDVPVTPEPAWKFATGSAVRALLSGLDDAAVDAVRARYLTMVESHDGAPRPGARRGRCAGGLNTRPHTGSGRCRQLEQHPQPGAVQPPQQLQPPAFGGEDVVTTIMSTPVAETDSDTCHGAVPPRGK
jgi:hypothetical protein